MKNLYIIITLMLTIFLNSCSSTSAKLQTLKPDPDDASPLVFDQTASYISLPITIQLTEIENQTNKALNDLVYEDNDFEDDNMTIKIWKIAPIRLKTDVTKSVKKLITILPLRAQIKYRIGTNKFGLNLYDTREIQLNGKVTLSSEIQLNNWKLNTKTEFKSIDWEESPSIVIAGKNVSIDYLIKPLLSFYKPKLEKKLDEAISSTLDFKPHLMATLAKICTPFQINESYETWLRIKPVEVYNSPIKLTSEAVILNMGTKCFIETIVGHEPESSFSPNKIVLKTVNVITNQIETTINAISTYADASKIMTKNFANQEFSSGTKKVIVKDVSLWHKNNKLVIALDVLGTVNGTLYLTGVPSYDQLKKEIYFKDLDYVLDTKSQLLKTANWLAQGVILNKMQESCRYSIQTNIMEASKEMSKYISNYEPIEGVRINGKLEEIVFDKVQLTNQAILATLKLKGAINANINGLQ